jgi:hypothetical protein
VVGRSGFAIGTSSWTVPAGAADVAGTSGTVGAGTDDPGVVGGDAGLEKMLRRAVGDSGVAGVVGTGSGEAAGFFEKKPMGCV